MLQAVAYASSATGGSASLRPGPTRAPCSTRSGRRSSTRRPSAARSWGCSCSSGSTRARRSSIQAFLYTLATRTGAPGPRPLHVRAHPGRRARGRLAHRHDRGDRGGLPGPRHHPDLGLRLHGPRRPAARARGEEIEETWEYRAAPRGWRSIDGRTTGVPRSGERQRRRAAIRSPAGRRAPAGRPLRPRPVLPLALPVLRLRRRGRRGGHRPAQPGRGVRGGAAARARPARAASRRRSTRHAAGRPTPRRGPPAVRAARRSTRSTSAAARRRCSPPTRSRSWSSASAPGSASRTAPR